MFSFIFIFQMSILLLFACIILLYIICKLLDEVNSLSSSIKIIQPFSTLSNNSLQYKL